MRLLLLVLVGSIGAVVSAWGMPRGGTRTRIGALVGIGALMVVTVAAFLLRLRGQGAVPKALIAAFEATPRRGFLSGQFHSIAWSDGMLPIECGEAIEGADLQAAVIAARRRTFRSMLDSLTGLLGAGGGR